MKESKKNLEKYNNYCENLNSIKINMSSLPVIKDNVTQIIKEID